MKKVIAVVLLWVACGFVDYGSFLGYFTHKFPYMNHRSDAMLFTLSGPFGLLPSAVYGQGRFVLHQASCEDRWKEFQREGLGNLGKDYFERENC